jgi:hypothetical protein
MNAWSLRFCVLCLTALMLGCQPAKPPPTPLPTKEKTIDKVKDDVDKSMKQVQDKIDAEDPQKKGY